MSDITNCIYVIIFTVCISFSDPFFSARASKFSCVFYISVLTDGISVSALRTVSLLVYLQTVSLLVYLQTVSLLVYLQTVSLLVY